MGPSRVQPAASRLRGSARDPDDHPRTPRPDVFHPFSPRSGFGSAVDDLDLSVTGGRGDRAERPQIRRHLSRRPPAAHPLQAFPLRIIGAHKCLVLRCPIRPHHLLIWAVADLNHGAVPRGRSHVEECGTAHEAGPITFNIILTCSVPLPDTRANWMLGYVVPLDSCIERASLMVVHRQARMG